MYSWNSAICSMLCVSVRYWKCTDLNRRLNLISSFYQLFVICLDLSKLCWLVFFYKQNKMKTPIFSVYGNIWKSWIKKLRQSPGHNKCYLCARTGDWRQDWVACLKNNLIHCWEWVSVSPHPQRRTQRTDDTCQLKGRRVCTGRDRIKNHRKDRLKQD